MINLFDNLRYWGADRNHFLSKIHYYQMMNGGSQLLANLLLPTYFQCTGHSSSYSLATEKKKSDRLIVSLTSFPARISKVWLVVESMLRQTHKPDKIILWLTKEQIPDMGALPENLLALRKRGLDIVLCDDMIRSHTKYYYAFQQYPQDIVITIDDDIIYRTDFIENLLSFHERFPQAIIANWAKKIVLTADNKSLYSSWPEASAEDIGIVNYNYSIFGVGGVLYPPHSVYRDCFNLDLIKRLSLTADDIWLSCMAVLNKTPFVFTGYRQNHLPVSIKSNTTLLDTNRSQNQVCVDNLNAYYRETLGVNPFGDIAQHTKAE